MMFLNSFNNTSNNTSRCAKCGKETANLTMTAYGDYRCEHCYDDYLMTDRGKVEYLLGIVFGEFPVDDYDADFLGHVATCWNKYRNELMISASGRTFIEYNASVMGLL